MTLDRPPTQDFLGTADLVLAVGTELAEPDVWLEGTLTLAESQAHMNIKLGFLMGAFKGAIESKVAEKMRSVFAAA